MIPYFVPPSIPLGPLKLEPFGLMAGLGVLLGVKLMSVQAEKAKLDSKLLSDFAVWALVGGLVSGHWVHLFFYHPEELQKHPLQFLKFWDGLSSTGGLLGGIVAAAIFFRLRKVPFAAYADVLALGIAPGWAVARLGCFFVHDHPGVRTDFFLAVRFPGGARHDLGLYDALLLAAATGLLFLLRHRKLLAGELLSVLAVVYGVGRFWLDFLRASDLSYVDARHFGLTFAQYASVAMVAYGLIRLARFGRRRAG